MPVSLICEYVFTHALSDEHPFCAHGHYDCAREVERAYPGYTVPEMPPGLIATLPPYCSAIVSVPDCYSCGNGVDAEGVCLPGGDCCSKCLPDVATVCERCECYASDSEITVFDGLSYCGNCIGIEASRCSSCCEYARPSDLVGGMVCEPCYLDNYFTCETCGSVLRDEYHSEDGMCNACYEDRGCIRPYGWKPVFKFEKTEKEKHPVYFGWELEVTGFDRCRESLAEDLQREFSWLWCVHDSSTCDDGASGFEIVSHPATADVWREREIERVCRMASKARFMSWDHALCGFHIHIGRENLSPLTSLRMMRLVYNCREQFFQLSGRDEVAVRNWCSFDKSQRSVVLEAKPGSYRLDGRYVAINTSTHTYELRFFRGSLKPSTLRGYLECAESLVGYAGVFRPVKSVSWESYIEYVDDNRKRFPNLIELLSKRGLLNVSSDLANVS